MRLSGNIIWVICLFQLLLTDCTNKYANTNTAPSPTDYQSQQFTVNTDKQEIITGEKGGIYVIKKNAFLDNDGNTIKGDVDIEIKEIFEVEDYIESGIQTLADTNILISDGVFYFNATKDGEQLQLNPKTGVYVSVPAKAKDKDMGFFSGVQDSSGKVNWQLVENKKEEKAYDKKAEELFLSYAECDRFIKIIGNYYTLKNGTYYDKDGHYDGFNSFKQWYVDDVKELIAYYETKSELQKAKRQFEKKYGMTYYEYSLNTLGWSNLDKYPKDQQFYFTGRVLLPNNKPAKDTRVHIFCPDNMFHVMRHTDNEGKYKFKFLKDQQFKILAFRNKNCRGEKEFVLTENNQKLETLVLASTDK